MHYFTWNISKYRRDCFNLSLLEHGIYRQLLDICYDTELPLPEDFTQICRLIGARSHDEKEAVSHIINDFFTLEKDGYRQSGCVKVLAEIYGKSEKAAASVSKRWEKHRKKEAEKKQKEEKENAKKYERIENTYERNTNVSEIDTNESKNDTTSILPKVTLITLDTNVSNNSQKTEIIIPEEKPVKDKITFSAKDLIAIGIDEQVAKDFISTRKSKLTLTALKGIQRESLKANISLAKAFQIATERGWQSFKAEWIKDKNNAGYVSFEELAKGDDYDPTNKF